MAKQAVKQVKPTQVVKHRLPLVLTVGRRDGWSIFIHNPQTRETRVARKGLRSELGALRIAVRWYEDYSQIMSEWESAPVLIPAGGLV